MERSVLKLLLDKAGVAAEDQYKKLMEGDAADIPVTDAVGGAILAKLLTVDGAVNHTEVRAKLKPIILKDVDDKTLSILTAAGVSEEDAKKVIEGKSTPDKIDEVIKKLGELDTTKGKKTKDERETEWNTTKTRLETDLQTAKTEAQQARDNAKALKFGYDFRDFMSDKERAGLALLKGLPVDTQLRLIREDLTAAATAKGLTIDFDDKGKLRYFDKEGKLYNTPGEADPYDVRTDLEGVVKKLGFVDTAPPKADPPRPANLPPGEPVPDSIAASSQSANMEIFNSLPKATPPAGS